MHLHKLAGFIRHRPEIGADWLEDAVSWEPEMLALVQSSAFSGFEWASARGKWGVRVMGIRALLAGSTPLTAQFQSAGFRILGSEHFRTSATTGDFEQLAVAELLSAYSVRIHLCWLGAYGQWHVALRFSARQSRSSSAR